MGYEEHKHLSPQKVHCAVIIISDSRTEKTDESGKLLVEGLKSAGHEVVSFSLLKNDREAIQGKMGELLHSAEVQAIIASGGTGASKMDITIETVLPMLEKRLDGFGELFRYLTYQEIGTGSILSRSTAGVALGKAVICLPGSLKAVKLALEKIILPEIGHLVREAAR
ncbi:MAG: molybdenum cofactor biosynthesis protein MoaB [Dehalococcoidia bacterium]|nr:MAG: molybdenum cofactor biosynthesis protein MoaB [Dehalococcoidia bacterium]